MKMFAVCHIKQTKFKMLKILSLSLSWYSQLVCKSDHNYRALETAELMEEEMTA